MASQSLRGMYGCSPSPGYIGKKEEVLKIFVFMSWTDNVRIKINP